MRVIKLVALAAAIGSATAAHADPLCDVIKNAVAMGTQDKTFAAAGARPAAPRYFTCSVSVEEGKGFYACAARVTPPEGLARANAIVASLKQCLAVEPVMDNTANQVRAAFVVSKTPDVRVIVDAADYATQIYLNVVAF